MPSRHNPAIRLAKELPPAARERLLATGPEGLDRETLVRAYLDEERSICSIAAEHDCRASTVLFHLALHGIPLRSMSRDQAGST
jgi:hypothetical protein